MFCFTTLILKTVALLFYMKRRLFQLSHQRQSIHPCLRNCSQHITKKFILYTITKLINLRKLQEKQLKGQYWCHFHSILHLWAYSGLYEALLNCTILEIRHDIYPVRDCGFVVSCRVWILLRNNRWNVCKYVKFAFTFKLLPAHMTFDLQCSASKYLCLVFFVTTYRTELTLIFWHEYLMTFIYNENSNRKIQIQLNWQIKIQYRNDQCNLSLL